MKRTLTLPKLICTNILVLLAISVSSQNLVPNPGFEVQDTCPAVSQIYLAQPWVSATTGTPDLYNTTCPTQNASARTGIGSSGVYCLNTFANNREYMEVPLTSSLVNGQTYCVNFYVSRLNYRYACNRMGAYFSVGAVNQATTSVLPFIPQVENNPGNMLSAIGWIQIWGSFVASGGESHLILGNFSNDADTDTLVVNAGSTSKVAYYKIDDVSVMACAAGMEETGFAEENITVYPSPANDKVNIRVEKDMSISKIEILSVTGGIVKSTAVNYTAAGTFTTDLSELNNGIYIISLSTEFGIVNKRIVVSR
ncbi:MAG: T9SS type A sorting domain-containing protein [Flavobacteriales bacterium]